VCWKKFQIPLEGLDGLQDRFFIQQLVDVPKAFNERFDEVPCEVCSEESQEDLDKIQTAAMYCVDCDRKLCERCSRPHRKMKSNAHQLGAEVEQELIQLRRSSLDKDKHELTSWRSEAESANRGTLAQVSVEHCFDIL